MATLDDLGHAIAALARYANHDSQCEWRWSLTNPRKPCSCGFDDAICAVSDIQDALSKESGVDQYTIDRLKGESIYED